MGELNRTYLGLITKIIFHNIRNVFKSKELYITKRKKNITSNKHPEIIHYIDNHNFQIVLDNTIATCNYEEDGLYNFISFIDNQYILYAISTNNYHNELGTAFIIKNRQMKKCIKSIKFFNEKSKKEFLDKIN